MRSALGREVNMSALIARNEKTRAVGNMNVNARGDLIDSNNNVIISANKRVESNYNNTVNQDDNFGFEPTFAKNTEPDKISVDNDITEEDNDGLLTEEQELFNDDEEVKSDKI